VITLKRLAALLAAVAALIGGLAFTTARPATAAAGAPALTLGPTDCATGPHDGVRLSICVKRVTQGSTTVATVQWGFAYRNSSTHPLRAWTLMSWASGWRGQVDKLNLGDRNGVLKSIGPVDNPGGVVQTAAVSCHAAGYYNSDNHFSLRPPGGDPIRFQTGEASWHLGTDICRDY
jgi:hypothetical protein